MKFIIAATFVIALPLSAQTAAKPTAKPAKPTTKLTLADARKIAIAKEPGKIQEGELEHEKGIWIYSFDILRDGKTHEVNIDHNTGAIIYDHVESASAEAAEKTAEAKAKPAAH